MTKQVKPEQAAKTPAKAISQAKAKVSIGATSLKIENIEALEQVRTEFNEQDLVDLAASLERDGLLQPILVRQADGVPGRFYVIAGERRLRAAQMLGWSHIDATIRQADDQDTARLQLVENIQREELSLADTAAGVLALYEQHKALQPIAEMVGKSVPWVSKHLSVATKLDWRVQQLLTDGRTEDLDLLLILNQISALQWGWDVLMELTDGEKMPSRKKAKEALDVLRQRIAQAKTEQAREREHQPDLLAESEQAKAEREAINERAEKQRADDAILHRIMEAIRADGPPINIDLELDAIDAPTYARIEAAITADMAEFHAMGWKAFTEKQRVPVAIFRAVRTEYALQENAEEQAAFVIGLSGTAFKLRDWLHLVAEIVRT
jgi:ParB/RepB/Spo0J family partition protein